MNSIGEDVPSVDTIEEFGVVSACYETNGNFALIKPGEYAARGRFGTTPLYWNRVHKIFSFRPRKGLDEFPSGCAYFFDHDRIVCWDDPWFEKPLNTSHDATDVIRMHVKRAVDRFIGKTDAFLYSSGCGSRLVNQFVPEEMMSYTIGHVEKSIDIESLQERTMSVKVFFDETSHWPKHLEGAEIPMYILGRSLNNTTSHRRFITGLGCTELFSGSGNYLPYTKHIVDQFATFGLEVWSPFFDMELIEYVLEFTTPKDRQKILSDLVDGELPFDGDPMEDTIDIPEKKTWWKW
jgi:asparagine synthetase B (glutamine-hydrolysing)